MKKDYAHYVSASNMTEKEKRDALLAIRQKAGITRTSGKRFSSNGRRGVVS